MYTIEKWYNKVYVLAISVYGFMNVFLLEYRHKDRSRKKQTSDTALSAPGEAIKNGKTQENHINKKELFYD